MAFFTLLTVAQIKNYWAIYVDMTGPLGIFVLKKLTTLVPLHTMHNYNFKILFSIIVF